MLHYIGIHLNYKKKQDLKMYIIAQVGTFLKVRENSIKGQLAIIQDV